MRHRVLCAAVLVVLVAAGAAGCSVRTQSEPDVIDKREVPFGLANDEPSGADTAAPAQGQTFDVYLLSGDGVLAPVPRAVVGTLAPAQALRTLLEGASDAETAFGLRSAIPSGTVLRNVDVRGTRARVDLGGALEDAAGADRIDAFAQMVYTLTQIDPITEVSFELQGRPIEVPTRGGELTGRAVTRADYAS